MWDKALLFSGGATPRMVVGPAAIALHDKATRTGTPCRFQQVVSAFGPQPIGERERVIETFEIIDPGKAGHLMDDDVRPGSRNRLYDRVPIQSVCHNRFGSERSQGFSIPG
jgi:hypothetical protein